MIIYIHTYIYIYYIYIYMFTCTAYIHIPIISQYLQDPILVPQPCPVAQPHQPTLTDAQQVPMRFTSQKVRFGSAVET